MRKTLIRKAATQYAEISMFSSVCLETAPEAEESQWQGLSLSLCTGNAEVPEIELPPFAEPNYWVCGELPGATGGGAGFTPRGRAVSCGMYYYLDVSYPIGRPCAVTLAIWAYLLSK